MTTNKTISHTASVPGDAGSLEAAYGRMREAKHFWKQALASYDDSESFRINVNACIQALRNITWLLQSEKDHIPGFDSWYAKWQTMMDGDSTLKWLVKARNRIVKQADLKTESKARVFLILGYREPPVAEFLVSPRLRAEAIARRLRESEDTPRAVRDRGMVAVERRWVDSGLPTRELLDALAHCYRFLGRILGEACGLVGVVAPQANGEDMFAARRDRLVILELKTGARITVQSTVEEYSDTFLKGEAPDLEKHYGIKPKRASPRPVLEAGHYWLARAKQLMRVDGAHKTFVFFYAGDEPGMNEPIRMTEVRWEDQGGKYVAWRHIADEAVELGATAVMMIGELWAVEARDWIPQVAIDDQPSRAEFLTVSVVTRRGVARSWHAPILRTKSGIRFGKTLVEDSAPMGLRPLVLAWRVKESESDLKS